MATRLNTGGAAPYSSLWGPTEKGQIEGAMEIQPVHLGGEGESGQRTGSEVHVRCPYTAGVQHALFG